MSCALAFQGDERLLKLYESGLPAWAIYAPQYGVWYRPWLRRVTYLLFVLVSAFSLVMGFYDLYKNVPYLDKVRIAFLDCFVSGPESLNPAGSVTCTRLPHRVEVLTHAAIVML